jgi:hypothetical protein
MKHFSAWATPLWGSVDLRWVFTSIGFGGFWVEFCTLSSERELTLNPVAAYLKSVRRPSTIARELSVISNLGPAETPQQP